MFKEYLIKGIAFGIGIVIFFGILFSVVFAAGFHNANEILSGTFLGNYTFYGIVGIGTDNPTVSLDVNGTLRANSFLVGNESNISMDKLFFIQNFIPLANATAQCPSGRAIYVPPQWQGRSGDDICAADIASDGPRNTCVAVKSFYVTTEGGIGFYSGSDGSCSNTSYIYWPYGNNYGTPNSRPDEWIHDGFIICCST